MSEDPMEKTDVDEGFTAWVPDVLFAASQTRSSGRQKQDRSGFDEPELRGDRWLSEIEQKAKDEGFRAGFVQGLAEGNEQMEDLRENLRILSDGVPGALEKSLIDRLDSMSDVVLDVVSRLVGDHLATAEGIRNLLEMAIRRRTSNLSGVLLVSPEMAAMIERLDPELKKELSGRKVELEASPSMSLAQISFRTEFHSASIDPLSGIRDLETLLREGLGK